MPIRTCLRALMPILIFVLCATHIHALIMIGGAEPVTNRDWPSGSENVANQPSRHSFREGPPFGGGQYMFLYNGDTAQFQVTLDALAAVEWPRRELVVFDGVPHSSTDTAKSVSWNFEIWSAENYQKLNNNTEASMFMSRNPGFGHPYPAPRITVYLGPDNPIDFSAITIPDGVTLLDRRVATSPWADSTGGVVQAFARDMTTGQPIPGAILEAGTYNEDQSGFKVLSSAIADDSGMAILKNLPEGIYHIRLRAEGYASRIMDYYRNYGRTLGVFDADSLSPAASISGVVHGPKGDPLEGAEVRVNGLIAQDGTGYSQNLTNVHHTTRSDAAGRFTLDGLSQGLVGLSVKCAGFHYFSFEGHPVPGPEVSIDMDYSGKVFVRVLNSAPVPKGMEVQVEINPVGDPLGRWGGAKKLEGDGTVVFEGIPDDTYTVTPFVVKPEPSGYGYTITSPVDQQKGEQITMERGQTINVELTVKPPLDLP